MIEYIVGIVVVVSIIIILVVLILQIRNLENDMESIYERITKLETKIEDLRMEIKTLYDFLITLEEERRKENDTL